MLQRFEYQIFADYSQFYLQDDDIRVGDLGDAWTEQAVARLLAVSRFVVGVGTVRNMTVPVCVEVMDVQPNADFKGFDQVNECSIELPSGSLVVAGCTDYFPDAARIKLASGNYVVRVSYSGLETLDETGLEGNDRYLVQLWPGDLISPRVVKARC